MEHSDICDKRGPACAFAYIFQKVHIMCRRSGKCQTRLRIRLYPIKVPYNLRHMSMCPFSRAKSSNIVNFLINLEPYQTCREVMTSPYRAYPLSCARQIRSIGVKSTRQSTYPNILFCISDVSLEYEYLEQHFSKFVRLMQ